MQRERQIEKKYTSERFGKKKRDLLNKIKYGQRKKNIEKRQRRKE